MQQTASKRNKKIIILMIAIAICFLLAQFITMAVLSTKQNIMNSKLTVISQQNEDLSSDINYFSSIEAKREYARQELGYGENGEQKYISD